MTAILDARPVPNATALNAAASPVVVHAAPTNGTCPPIARPRYLVAGLLATTAVIHAALTPEHFREGWRFGTAFLVMALLQGLLAIALVLRPGARVDDLARRSTVALVALYLFARVVPVPGQLRPEDATVIGGLTVALEVAALVALTRLPRRRAPRLGPVPAGVLAALATTIAVLLTTGALRYLPGVDLSREYTGTAPVLIWQDDGKGLSPDSPLVTVYLTKHVVVIGSLFVLAFTGLLALEVGIGVAWSRRMVRAGRTERRHWFWMPALLAAPVCCGAPLLGIVGPAAFAILLRHGWLPLVAAVWLGAVSLALGARRDAPTRRDQTTTGISARRDQGATGDRHRRSRRWRRAR